MAWIVQTVVGATFVGGDFGADAALVGSGVVAQFDGLRDSALRIVRGRWANPVADNWLDKDVAIFLSAAGAADVRLRESADRFGHRCPAGIGQHAAVGAGLHHAKGHDGTGECAPHAHAADARVYTAPALCVEG